MFAMPARAGTHSARLVTSAERGPLLYDLLGGILAPKGQNFPQFSCDRSGIMDPRYHVRDTSHIFTPALLFYKDLIRRNIARAIEMAGSPKRLRPHVKTHKTVEIVHLELEAGIMKHKCATLAEAELLARAGAEEVFIAFNMVGPNCARLARLNAAYPKTRFAVTGDNEQALRALSAAMAER